MSGADPHHWHSRWRDGRIGFHQAEVNRLLEKFWPELVPEPAGDVFVPLAGKSIDMTWLARRGHQVVGVELSEIAVRGYYEDHGWQPEIDAHDGFQVFSANGVELWCGDYFAFPAARLKDCVGVYDRASLIALPEDMRRQYAAKLIDVVPQAATTLLLSIAYDQAEADGPPYSVPDDEVRALFGEAFAVMHHGTRDATAQMPNLTEKGVTHVTSSVFSMQGRAA